MDGEMSEMTLPNSNPGGRAHYLSVTEAPYNTEFYEWMGKKHFYLFQTAGTGKRTPSSGVKGSGAIPLPQGPHPTASGRPTICA